MLTARVTASLKRFVAPLHRAFSATQTAKEDYSRTWQSPLVDIVRHMDEHGRSYNSPSPLLMNRAKSPEDVLLELSDEEKKLLAQIHAEWRVLRDMGAPAPSIITPEHELELLLLPNRQKRESYFSFLFLNSCIKFMDKLKRSINHSSYLERKEQQQNTEPPNRILDNKIVHNRLTQIFTHKRFNSILWGQPIVIDMDFEQYMNQPSLRNMVKQTNLIAGLNGLLREPFHLHFCNVRDKGTQHSVMEKWFVDPFNNPNAKTKVRNLHDLHFTVSSKDVTQLFPMEDIVYLTPDARHPLKEVRHDKVYVIGGLNDKCFIDKITYVKCKKLGIPMARLPLDEYLHWETGAKTLTLDVCFNILAEQRDCGDWSTTLKKHVPIRHLVPKEPFSRFHSPVKHGVLDPRKKFFSRATTEIIEGSQKD